MIGDPDQWISSVGLTSFFPTISFSNRDTDNTWSLVNLSSLPEKFFLQPFH